MSRVEVSTVFAERSGQDSPDHNGCWIWRGAFNHHGRPVINDGNKKLAAHRVSYVIAHGSIPAGMVVCHRCDVPACVNPDHLFAGTQAENLADMTNKGRRARCGHPGERNPNAKLSDAIAIEILQEMDSGLSASVLAAIYGVNKSTICRLRKRFANA